MSYIEFRNVSKTYKTGSVEVHALDNCEFFIEKGELCVIVGQSGAGKTTLLNILGGMDHLTTGQVFLDGREISALQTRELAKFRRENVGFVFQFYNLISNLTAYENVEMAAQLVKDPIDCDLLMNEVGLADRRNNFPAQLLLQHLSTDKKMTVVIITHNSALTAMADRVIRVKNGKVISNVINTNPVNVDDIEW